MNIPSIVKNETLMIKISVAVFGLVLAGVLVGTWLSGIDLSAIFLGTPWQSPYTHTQGIIAIEGGIIAVTLLFGGLFIAGLMVLIVRR